MTSDASLFMDKLKDILLLPGDDDCKATVPCAGGLGDGGDGGGEGGDGML